MELSQGWKLRGETAYVWEIKSFPVLVNKSPDSWECPVQFDPNQYLQQVGICYHDANWSPVVQLDPQLFVAIGIIVQGKEPHLASQQYHRLCIVDDEMNEVWTSPVLKHSRVTTSFYKKLISPEFLSTFIINFHERKKKYFFKLIFYDQKRDQLMPGSDPASEDNSFLVKHMEALEEDFGDILKIDDDHDVTLLVKGIELKAHRLVLKARSPVFQRMFIQDTEERNTGLVQIDDCDPYAFEHFLHYLYSGSVTLTRRNAANLYRISDKYEVADLAKSCAGYMMNNFTVRTFSDYVSLAAVHNEAGLLETGIEFMARHVKEVLDSKEWKDFVAENPLVGNEILSKALFAK